jgi:hypothetical protein
MAYSSEGGLTDNVLVEVSVGDRLVLTKKAPVNAGEAKKGGLILCEMKVGTEVLVLKVGEDLQKSKRAKISDGQITGWITVTPGSMGNRGPYEPKDSPPVKIDLACENLETKSVVTMRKQEDVLSEYVKDLPMGTSIVVLERGRRDQRRARVRSCNLEGWISVATGSGAPLVGKQGGFTLKSKTYTNKSQAVLEYARAGDFESLKRLTGEEGGSFFSVPAAPIRCYDTTGRTPLIMACAYGHYAIADYVIRKDPGQITLQDKTQKTALHHVVSRQQKHWLQTVHIANLLLEGHQGIRAEIDAKDILHRTPLMDACAHGDDFAVEALVAGKANLNAKDSFCQTPLDFAVHLDNATTARIMEKAGGVPGQAGPILSEDASVKIKYHVSDKDKLKREIREWGENTIRDP